MALTDQQLELIVVAILTGYVLVIVLTTYAVISSRSSEWLKVSSIIAFLIYAVGVPLTVAAKELSAEGLWQSLVSILPF